MTSISSSSISSSLAQFLKTTFPSAWPTQQTETEVDLASLSKLPLFPDFTYTEAEKKEMQHWIGQTPTDHHGTPSSSSHLQALNEHLSTRTTVIGIKPSIADIVAYHSLAPQVKTWSPEQRTGKDGLHHIVRWVDAVQNLPLFGITDHFGADGKITVSGSGESFEKVPIDVDNVLFVRNAADVARQEKERKKKEKAAAAAAGTAISDQPSKAPKTTTLPLGQPKPESTSKTEPLASIPAPPKREKKEKKEKAAPAPAAAAPVSPALVDLRVGHILHCKPHPDADSLYVSTIDVGDSDGADNTSPYDPSSTSPVVALSPTPRPGQAIRTICSGLNGLVPLAEMQGRKVIVVCNLKPVKMRGIVSAGMVLAASPRSEAGAEDSHGKVVELVTPPADAIAGQVCSFEGFVSESVSGTKAQLNPKKKIFETLQPGFGTDEQGRVVFDTSAVPEMGATGSHTALLKTSVGGSCAVASLKGATVR